MQMQILKNKSVLSLSLFIWEYIAFVLHKYYNKTIIKPSFLISKFNKIIKICFYKIGSCIGILYDKTFFVFEILIKYLKYYFNNLWYYLQNFGHYTQIVICKLGKFLNILFNNFWHCVINFFSDIVDTLIEIGNPMCELLESPKEILIGFYNKLNEISPFDIAFFIQILLITTILIFSGLLLFNFFKKYT